MNDRLAEVSRFSSSSSSCFLPAILAALETKYGGSSPIAVPAPHKKASKMTKVKIWNDVIVGTSVNFGHS
jgi:hypothetical protein